jgi:hypothetical protein
MYKFRSEQLRDMSLDELLTRLEFCAKDMRHACHPDDYDDASKLAWEILNALSNHRESPYGIDSKFRKAPFADPVTGKNLLDHIKENRERK